jgi:SH3 domain protein
MKKSARSSRLLVAALTSTLLAAPLLPEMSHARTDGFKHYISDELTVPVRRGPGYSYKIRKLLKAGTPVTVLEINEKGWAHIQYPHKGKILDGWVPSSLLSTQPAARQQLEEAQKTIKTLNEKLQQQNSQLTTLRAENEDLKKRLSEAQKQLFTLKKDYDHLVKTAGNAVRLDEENQQLKKDVARLEQENAMLKDQIAHSEDAVKRQWFLTGGGVLLLGLLLGRFFRLPQRRRSSWDEL